MAKFVVEVKEVWSYAVEVELPDDATKQQVLEAANQQLEEEDHGENMEYDRTLDPDSWTVSNKAGRHL